MNELLYVLQEQLRITHPSATVIFVSVADQKLGAGSAIIAFDSFSKCRARVFLTDNELAFKQATPGPSAFSLAWDLRQMLSDNGTEIEPQFLEALSLLS